VTESTPELIACPACGSSRILKNGFRSLKGGETQVFRCRDCGRKFSQKHKKSTVPNFIRQLCVFEEAKKLDTATENLNPVAGDSKDLNGKIVGFLFQMEKNGYALSTIRLNRTALKVLRARGANLADPESVKEVIANQKGWSGSRKRNVINAYTSFLRYLGLTWQPPKYTISPKIPFIPTEQEIDDLIAGCPNTVATFLQLLKETAVRCGEALRLKWRDVDFERRIITLNDPEKGSNPRIFNSLSGKLLSMLNTLPKENEKLFGTRTRHSLKNTYCRARRRMAFKLQNPRLNEIHFHTLRHWKATMEYHYSKDILHVKSFLGHKEIENTLIYIQLDKSLFQNIPEDSFTIRAAHTLEEAIKLGEVGFEPYVVMDGVQLFRKRK
jgi:integrase/DNA-directed RNA polymerase subunit RPC12/RpoP